MHLFDRPKVDSHCHVLDPARFAYGESIPYHPAGQEIGTASYFQQVLQAYGVRHALLVGPNSGYGEDNRCLLDAIAHGGGAASRVLPWCRPTPAARRWPTCRRRAS